MGWVVYSVLANFFFVILILLIKALTTKQLEPEILNLYFFLLTTVGFFLVAVFRRTSLAAPSSSYLLFLGLAIVAVAYNIFLVKAIELAPNPAYPAAIISSNVIIIALASVIIFGSEFNFTKLMGVILTVIGVVIVSLTKGS